MFMTLVSSSIPPLLMEGRTPLGESVHSSLSGLSLSRIWSIEEEEEDELEEKVYVAVGKEFVNWKENLRFALNNADVNQKIIFLHVHQPSMKIPTPIGYMPADRVKQQELRAYRLIEKENMNKALKPYLDNCKAHKFRAEIRTVDNSDIAKGLIELVKLYKVTNLIMGAASDKYHSKAKKENSLKSKTAITVQRNAEPSCRISFICKGELICIREASQNINNTNDLSRTSSSSSSSNSSTHLTHSQSLPPLNQAQQILNSSPLNHRSISTVGSPYSSYHSGLENNLYVSSNSGSSSNQYDNKSFVSDSLPTTPFDNSPPTDNNNIMEDIFARLEEALTEIDRMKREAVEELSQRHRAELDLVQAKRQLKAKESALKIEMQKRAEIEENFAKQSDELENYKLVLDQTLNGFYKSNEQKISLIKKLEGRVLSVPSFQNSVNCSEFSLLELKEATNNFDEGNKIGEGGYGSVYKGCLRHTLVAIKILNRDGIGGDEQFYQEVEILSRVRHPHLVTLIGACLENRALIYEFMPQMSLDDHLTYKKTLHTPLPWQARVRIAREICSALIFLHSARPQCIVHSDLKPENILLDSNNVSKLSDFGICRQLNRTSTTVTPYHLTEHPKGTFSYMDPEYLSSGELTPHYDVFSFGIVLLQLVTGREARNIRNILVEAVEKGRLGQVVDKTAGNWPFKVAEKMVHLGIRCSKPTRRMRPDLARDVLRVIEAMVNVVPEVLMKRSLSEPAPTVGSSSRSGKLVPPLFVCPLSKEIMVDPQIAADGYTYEARSILDWFNQGKNISPITNKKLESFKLVQNNTLRSAIQDWLNQQLDLYR
ncbi:hypothetical protein LUZ60_012140 [Juncus effusus]|nr:hypothetical protein LUZ60_012140 [Juncus effusus]